MSTGTETPSTLTSSLLLSLSVVSHNSSPGIRYRDFMTILYEINWLPFNSLPYKALTSSFRESVLFIAIPKTRNKFLINQAIICGSAVLVFHSMYDPNISH